MHPGLLTLTLFLTLTLIQARVAAISQVAREERAALAAAEDAEGDDELIA